MGRDRVMERPPLFLTANEDLWRAWSRLQASGRVEEIRGEGWRVWTELDMNGETVFRLALEIEWRRRTEVPILGG